MRIFKDTLEIAATIDKLKDCLFHFRVKGFSGRYYNLLRENSLNLFRGELQDEIELLAYEIDAQFIPKDYPVEFKDLLDRAACWQELTAFKTALNSLLVSVEINWRPASLSKLEKRLINAALDRAIEKTKFK